MKKIVCLGAILFIFLFSPLIFSSSVLAKILFQEDFDDGNADGWIRVDDPDRTPCSADWEVTEDKMFGISIDQYSCTTNMMPDDTLWRDLPNDYIFEVDMKFVRGTDHNVAFRFTPSPTSNDWYDIHFQSPDTFVLERVPPGPQNNTVPYPVPIRELPYHIKIIMQTGNIKIFIDGYLALDYPYDPSKERFPTGRIALRAGTGEDPVSETYFDNIVVQSIEPEPTPTPTPTPTPVLQPLIFLPGLGGSWNHEEIFLGIDQPQSEWYKTPFIDNYNGLIQTLQNAGYTLGENLFVFYYDWLQPIAQTATDLKNYIDTVVDPPLDTEVDLLGHSLGGLVARTYIQNNPSSHHVDQLITLGSPHKGVPQVYWAWEGASLHRLLGNIERIGAGIILRLHGYGYPNLVQAIRNFVPSLGNLLFIDDYLKWDKTGTIKPEPSMSQQNNWLKGLGTSSELLGLTNTIIGTAGDTPRWLKIVERNQIDEILGRWEDGKPIGEEAAIGDGTILEESARLEGANIITLAGLDHRELVQSKTGLEKILELLGKTDVEIVEQPEIPFEPALVFTVASPVTIRVTDPLGRKVGAGLDFSEVPQATFSAQEKIIIIPQAIDGKYKVEVLGENNGGSYQLLIGQLTQKQDIWSRYQGEITPNRPDTHTLPFDSNLQTTDLYLANLINSKLKALLRQIHRQRINLLVKSRLISKVFRILGRTEPLPLFLKLKRGERAEEYTQKAILKTTDTIDYAEKFNPDSLLALREILDLLGQLHQLLEN